MASAKYGCSQPGKCEVLKPQANLNSMKTVMPYSVPLPSSFSTSRLLSLLLVAQLVTLTVPRCLADRATYDPTKTWNAFQLDTPPVIDGVLNAPAGAARNHSAIRR